MAKRRKKRKFIEEIDVKENEFSTQVEKIVAGLYYISETDSEIFPFQGNKTEKVSVEEILKQTGSKTDTAVEERDFNELFARLIEIQDWFGDAETAAAHKFVELKKLLEENLKDVHVFKIGKINLDIYIVGLDAESNLTGIKTKAVET